MSIKTQEAAVSIDFAYEDEDNNQEYHIKFHPTKELGQTVSVSSDELIAYEDKGQTYVSLPASLMVEVVDFLRINNYLITKIGGKPQQKQVATVNPSRQKDSQLSSLPVPDIHGEGASSPMPLEGPRITSEHLSPGMGIQTLSMDSNAPEEVIEEEFSDNPEDEEVEIEDVDDEELSEIKQAAAERAKAQEKAKPEGKKFKLKPSSKKRIEEKTRQNSEIDYENIEEV